MTWPVCDAEATLALLIAAGSPFAVEACTVGGVPLRCYRNAPATMRRVLDDSRRFGARPLLVYEGERISFEAHWRAAHAFARALAERHGVGKGDRVAVALRNYPDWSACAWGALAAGAILVPLNAWEGGQRLAALLRDSGAKVAVVDREREERLRGMAHCAAIVRVRCDGAGEALTEWIGSPADWATLPDLPATDPVLAPDDPATIFYTSGTTGSPKGVLGSHRNLATNIVNTAFRFTRAAVRRTGRLPPPSSPRTVLLPLPLFHVTGFHSTLAPALANGNTVVLMYKWDVEKALDLVAKERVQALNLVPALATQLLDAIEAGATRDLSSLDTIGYGGSPAPAALAARVRRLVPGAWAAQGYGATETSSLVASYSHEDFVARPESVGVAPPCTELMIVAEDGREAAAGAPGELWVRGPQVVTGYWNQPEASEAAFGDGWYRTGDVVTLDAEGAIRVLDRIKDMIIRGGENIYCSEIEAELEAHPAVVECGVFGIPERVLGEVVAATARLRPGCGDSAEELRAHLAARLPAFKVPVAIALTHEPLPRNGVGKLLKRELRAAFLANVSPETEREWTGQRSHATLSKSDA